MKYIYVVSEADCDDFRVIAAYTSEQEAYNAKKRLKAGGTNIFMNKVPLYEKVKEIHDFSMGDGICKRCGREEALAGNTCK